ncbi:MAG: ABC transporter permease [Roseibium album]|uniref:ABC transporter permease n=1 Tax=Roseibium album TaxID=311410 RepID=UPI0032EFFF63
MTDTTLPSPRNNLNPFAGLMSGTVGPVTVVILAILAIWYIAAVALNAPFQNSIYERAKRTDVTFAELVSDTFSQEKPVLPAPHQVFGEISKKTIGTKLTSKRSLFFHAGITLSPTLLGFFIGTTLGILLAIGIVHSRVLEKSLMPWVISSQTIPILAIAPMIILVLNAINITGLLPKALISTYLSFFPITVGMVKGLRSPEVIHMDLMRTYSATRVQAFWKLRLPYAVPYLFTSAKIGIAASLVGAIVGELPLGATGGLGSLLLVNSYYSQTVQMWSALLMAAFLAGSLVALIGILEKVALKRMGMSR